MSCETCKGHDEANEVDEAKALKHIATVEQKYKLLMSAVVALVVMFAVMTWCMVYAVSNSQRIANEAVLKALEAVSEMEVVSETTTTTTVHQDTGEGDGNNVYLDGDNTEYSEAQGGDE